MTDLATYIANWRKWNSPLELEEIGRFSKMVENGKVTISDDKPLSSRHTKNTRSIKDYDNEPGDTRHAE